MSAENRDASVRHRDGWCLVRSGDHRVVTTSCDLSVTVLELDHREPTCEACAAVLAGRIRRRLSAQRRQASHGP